MIHEISERVSRGLCNLQQIEQVSKREEITYGMEMILATVVSVSASLLLSILMRCFKYCLMFLCVFMPLRAYAGGYHASTHLKCFITLIIDLMIGFLLIHISYLFNESILMTILIISDIVICKLSPVESENYPLSKRQRKHSKKRSLQILTIVNFINLYLFSQKQLAECFYITYALLSVAMSMLITKIIKRKEARSWRRNSKNIYRY